MPTLLIFEEIQRTGNKAVFSIATPSHLAVLKLAYKVGIISSLGSFITRITESSSWLHAGAPKIQTPHQRALSRHYLNSGNLAAMTTALGNLFHAHHPLEQNLFLKPSFHRSPPAKNTRKGLSIRVWGFLFVCLFVCFLILPITAYVGNRTGY